MKEHLPEELGFALAHLFEAEREAEKQGKDIGKYPESRRLTPKPMQEPLQEWFNNGRALRENEALSERLIDETIEKARRLPKEEARRIRRSERRVPREGK